MYQTVVQYTKLLYSVPHCSTVYRTVVLYHTVVQGTALKYCVPHYNTVYRTAVHLYCTYLSSKKNGYFIAYEGYTVQYRMYSTVHCTVHSSTVLYIIPT